MRRLFCAVIAGVCVQSFALVGVGDRPKNYCWKTHEEKTLCLDDASLEHTVVVLLYNAGWCGPCNSEFKELPKATAEFAGKPVTFVSLSASGWTNGAASNAKFLKEWRSKHKLDTADATFVVASSPRDAGNDFFSDVYIPNVVILNMNGDVAYKAINPGAKVIADEVRKLLPTPVRVGTPGRKSARSE